MVLFFENPLMMSGVEYMSEFRCIIYGNAGQVAVLLPFHECLRNPIVQWLSRNRYNYRWWHIARVEGLSEVSSIWAYRSRPCSVALLPECVLYFGLSEKYNSSRVGGLWRLISGSSGSMYTTVWWSTRLLRSIILTPSSSSIILFLYQAVHDWCQRSKISRVQS